MKSIAVDAQILLRNHARRMVFAMAEACGISVILPSTVITVAKLRYPSVCERYVRKTLEWQSNSKGEKIDEERMGLAVYDAVQQLGIGFARWLDEEAQRNDGIFTIAPRTRRTQGVAMEISNAGAVNDPRDQRWRLGEDPHVIAEALEAGAHWLASDNTQTIDPDALERWLDRVQGQGRFTDVPRPFILSAERALEVMQETHPRWYLIEGERMRRAVAYAVGRPRQEEGRSLTGRIAIAQRFATELRECGMRTSGREIERWIEKMQATIEARREEEVASELRELEEILPKSSAAKTREAEERRMEAEQLVDRRTEPSTKPPRPGGREHR